MAEGQRVRHLGSNMKPRGNKAVKPQKETKVTEEMTTAVGQAEGTKEAVLDPPTPADNSASFQAENEPEIDNSEGEKELMVAQVTDPELEKMMAESGENPQEIPTAEDMESAIADGSVETVEWPGRSASREIKLGSRNVLHYHGDLGPQPDGSLAFRGMIPEEYVEAVTQWAEENGVTIAQWCNDRLYEYISTYGSPAKGR